MKQNLQGSDTKSLPTLADLQRDINSAFKHDPLNLLLNQPPNESWVKKHPMFDGWYIPIGKIEFLLTYIFGEWWPEVLKSEVMANSISVTVRLHYRHPLTHGLKWVDGVGAMALQVDKGCSPSNLTAIKKDAVQMALPSAKSYALKDAAEHLGALFGRDLNRKDVIEYSGVIEKEQKKQKIISKKGNTYDGYENDL